MSLGGLFIFGFNHTHAEEETMMGKLTDIISRFLFGVAFVLTIVAVLEKLFRLFGSTILGSLYDPGRLMEFSAMVFVLVIAFQLREIKTLLRGKASD